ncbi:C-type lectin protein [Dichomitus squalens]|uniref:C-type lectin protein n=2 Tax=Dichomitus squalens TaxID=114155 RepID=A0A4Q9QBQ9_9APHY|nr:C-type lectin protein [Dichomitus squalens]
MRSSSPTSSCDSYGSAVSTAPSTPPPELAGSYFLVLHDASQAFLDGLLAKASSDRVLLCKGAGAVKPVLEEAAGVLGDMAVVDDARWERVVSNDNGSEAIYYKTKDVIATIDKKPSIALDTVQCDSKLAPHATMLNLFCEAGLRSIIGLPSRSANTTTTLYILERPPLTFPPFSSTPRSAPNPIANPYTLPSLAEFTRAWAIWDLITLGMIPSELLHSKPIDLRHKPLFYIGHLPTFANILLSRVIGEREVGPRHYLTTFERGIDPSVDDPERCHSHSEVPERDEDWPVIGDVLAYRDEVREKVIKRIFAEVESGERALTRRLARTMVMVHEHDGFHIETLLYMLIQRAGTGMLPPPGFAPPPWPALAAQWDAIPAPTTPTVTLGPATITMGHDDQEPDDLLPALEHDVGAHEFGWDNESPARAVHVGAFRVEWRPVTNGEFLAFWQGPGKDVVDMPASWAQTEDGEVRVRTLYGPVPMAHAKHWPVLTAYDDLAKYAAHKGGRIPTEPELRLFLDAYQVGYEEGANTGFRHWHPLPATAGLQEIDGGRGSNGGVWEWTATALDAHPGFVGTGIFPGYSSDFFDGKHQVVLGASYATIPRLGDRRTVRNFYQHNYPYPWVGARVAYDV